MRISFWGDEPVEDQRLIYLNNAATTWPKPAGVIETVKEVFRYPFLEHGRTTAKEGTDYVGNAREDLAGLFSVRDPEQIVLTASATDSLNMLIHGFARHQPERFHAITSDLEHNSVLRPLRTLEREGKISLSIVRAEGAKITPDFIINEVRDDTALVVIGHGSNVLGSVQDIEAIGKLVRKTDAFFLVDGAQTAGQYPIDLSSSSVDAFVFTGHKSLFGFPGTGGFYIRKPEVVDPVKQGGTGVDSKALFQPEELPLKFETGTPNYPGIASLSAGVRFVNARGIGSIVAQSEDMTSYLVSALSDIDTVTIFNPDPDLPIITFSIEGIENEDVGFILMKAYNIVVRTGLHCAPLVHERVDGGYGGVRISLSCMNSMDDCHTTVAAIEEIAESVQG